MIQDHLVEAYKAAIEENNYEAKILIYRLLFKLTAGKPDEYIANYKPRKRKK